MNLLIEHLTIQHEHAFLEAVARSTRLHRPWVAPPTDSAGYRELLGRYESERNKSYLCVNEDKDLIGFVSLNEIVRGAFQSAYLGFYSFIPFSGQGLMKQAMILVLTEAFTTHQLHRLEANVQPRNERSKGLVRSIGLRLEGFSPRYLQIGGQWCDHERYAITAEEWASEQFATRRTETP